MTLLLSRRRTAQPLRPANRRATSRTAANPANLLVANARRHSRRHPHASNVRTKTAVRHRRPTRTANAAIAIRTSLNATPATVRKSAIVAVRSVAITAPSRTITVPAQQQMPLRRTVMTIVAAAIVTPRTATSLSRRSATTVVPIAASSRPKPRLLPLKVLQHRRLAAMPRTRLTMAHRSANATTRASVHVRTR